MENKDRELKGKELVFAIGFIVYIIAAFVMCAIIPKVGFSMIVIPAVLSVIAFFIEHARKTPEEKEIFASRIKQAESKPIARVLNYLQWVIYIYIGYKVIEYFIITNGAT